MVLKLLVASALTQSLTHFFVQDDAEKFARYSRYVQSGDDQEARTNRRNQIKKEFEDHLYDVNLQSDDVPSVLKVRFFVIDV